MLVRELCNWMNTNSLIAVQNCVTLFNILQQKLYSTVHLQSLIYLLRSDPHLSKGGLVDRQFRPSPDRWTSQVLFLRLVYATSNRRRASFVRCSLTWNGRCALEKAAPPRYRPAQVSRTSIGRVVTWYAAANWMNRRRNVPAIYRPLDWWSGVAPAHSSTFVNEKSTCQATFAREVKGGRGWLIPEGGHQHGRTTRESKRIVTVIHAGCA